MGRVTYYRAAWPDPVVPEESPEWTFYEVDWDADAVTRTVEVFKDGRVERDSLELEERKGDSCPSLVDMSLDDAFAGVCLDEVEIPASEFEAMWNRGVDTPFWFPDRP